MKRKSYRKCLLLTRIFLTLMILFGSVSNVFASGNLWYDKYLPIDEGLERDWYPYLSPCSDKLAWGATYILDSYYHMYNVT